MISFAKWNLFNFFSLFTSVDYFELKRESWKQEKKILQKKKKI